jgi:hypothetical protein
MTNVLYCPECPVCAAPTLQVQYADAHYQPHCTKCSWPLSAEAAKYKRRYRKSSEMKGLKQ